MAKMPQAWTNAGAGPATAPATRVGAAKVEARIDMSAEVAGCGLCPDCRKPMVIMSAGPVETNTCMDCRISLPLADGA